LGRILKRNRSKFSEYRRNSRSGGTLEILVLGRLRLEDHKCETSLGYIERPCLKKNRGHGSI
jgi:hypothetical protein